MIIVETAPPSLSLDRDPIFGITHGLGDHAHISLKNIWDYASHWAVMDSEGWIVTDSEDVFILLFAQTVGHEWLHMLVMREGYTDAYETTIKSVTPIGSVKASECQRCGGPSDEIYLYEYAPGQKAGPLCEDCSRKIEFLYSVLDG